MATILAAQNGNWSATSTWIGGVVPTTGDVVVANNRTVAIDVNVTCTEVRHDTTGGATAGGGFTLNNGVTLTANIYGGGTGLSSSCVTFSGGAGTSATVYGNVFGSSLANVSGLSHAGNGVLNIFGNVTGGSSTNASGVTGTTLSGIINIVGDVTGGTGGSGAIGAGTNTGILNITGNVTGNVSYGAYLGAGGRINITGNVTGGVSANGSGVWNLGAGAVFVTGSVAGGSGIDGVRNNSTGVVFIAGNVTATTATAIVNSAGGAVTITGNVTGGSSGSIYGAFNSSTGVVTIVGQAIGGTAGPGAFNNSTGTLTVTRAVGNGFGPGSVGLSSTVGVVSNNVNSRTNVEEIEFGALGQAPTSGPIQLVSKTTNVCVVYRGPGLSKKTLVSPDTTANLTPDPANVRSGVVYEVGNKVGTMAVPAAASVALGVPVDNTTGTAALSPADIWNILTGSLNVPGSIGERLKNCATVASTGQQIVDAMRAS